MELMECFKERRSVRSFTTDEVPDEVIEGALTVANLAPSAGNMQARDFVVVRDADTREKLTR
jgi:nitroreductase